MIRLVARCDYQVLDGDEAKAFVRQIGQEIARSFILVRSPYSTLPILLTTLPILLIPLLYTLRAYLTSQPYTFPGLALCNPEHSK